MRIQRNPDGYTMWLSASDTENWASRPGAEWLCSTLYGHRCVVVVDQNGLCDFSVDGKDPEKFDIDGQELDAIVGDHLPQDLRHLWPTWAPQHFRCYACDKPLSSSYDAFSVERVPTALTTLYGGEWKVGSSRVCIWQKGMTPYCHDCADKRAARLSP